MNYVFKQVGRLYLIALMDGKRLVSACGTTSAYTAARMMDGAVAQKQIAVDKITEIN